MRIEINEIHAFPKEINEICENKGEHSLLSFPKEIPSKPMFAKELNPHFTDEEEFHFAKELSPRF